MSEEAGTDWIGPKNTWPEPKVMNISGQGLDWVIDGSEVTYSYPFKEFHGIEQSSSSKQGIKTSSSCKGRTLIYGTVYDKDAKVENDILVEDSKCFHDD